MTEGNATLTGVGGIRVGHASVPGGGSGVTVLLGPFRGAAELRGTATGTREMPVLRGDHLVPFLDAVVLTGGSAMGLSTADGVSDWLVDRGQGYETAGGPVPIVPAAVIYDLAPGRGRPDRTTGRAACQAASDQRVEEGRVGAGAGARVGRIRGEEHSSAGGVGSTLVGGGAYKVGALTVTNALGDVVDRDGRILAGALGPDGGFLDTDRYLLEGEEDEGAMELGLRNTTLAVVATDAPLGKVELGRLARMASTALPRRITPVNTPYDGDVVVALSTAMEDERGNAPGVLSLGVQARVALEEAILRSVADGPPGDRRPSGPAGVGPEREPGA